MCVFATLYLALVRHRSSAALADVSICFADRLTNAVSLIASLRSQPADWCGADWCGAPAAAPHLAMHAVRTAAVSAPAVLSGIAVSLNSQHWYRSSSTGRSRTSSCRSNRRHCYRSCGRSSHGHCAWWRCRFWPLSVSHTHFCLCIVSDPSYSHSHTLTINCTCCDDEIKGTQDLKIYSHAHSLILSRTHF